MVDTSERRPGAVWRAFEFDVRRATVSLMYLLQGMEAVREAEKRRRESMAKSSPASIACLPDLTYVNLSLWMSGVAGGPQDVVRREGEVEQVAFKGWVEEVYFAWESRSRNLLKDSLEGQGSIRPKADVLGDFRHIRNDIIHNNGVASEDETGRCTLLRWFQPRQRIVMGIGHVFDLMNHLGFMNVVPAALDDGATAAWTLHPERGEELCGEPPPRVVSFRTVMDHEVADGTSWHLVSIVFEDGIYVHLPVQYDSAHGSIKQRIELHDRTRLDADGNLYLVNGVVLPHQELYRQGLDVLLGGGAKIEGLGLPGAAVRFKEE